MASERELLQEMRDRLERIEQAISGPGGIFVRVDRLEQAEVNRPCERHNNLLEQITHSQSRALAAWGIIVAVASAIGGLFWGWAKDWFRRS